MAMKIKLTRAIEALVHIVSKDDTRVALKHIGVLINGRKRKAQVVATDGVVLLTTQTDLQSKGTETERMFRGNFLKRFLKLTTKKERSGDECGWVEVQDIRNTENLLRHRLVLAESSGRRLSERDYSIGDRPQDSPYPDVRMVWPDDSKDFQPWLLAVDTLKQLLDSAAMLRTRNEPVFITIWVPVTEDRSSAPSAGLIRISHMGADPENTLHGLIMPCRGDDWNMDPPDPFGVMAKKDGK